MPEELWIWPTRWEDFQHYRPTPERGPAWIKQYTAQLDDDRYLSLTDRQRALLVDLRCMHGTTRMRTRYDHVTIGQRRGIRTRHADLEALNHAGLIDILSRDALDQRITQVYRRSRAEVEVEKEKNLSLKTTSSARASSDPPAYRARANIQPRDPAAAIATMIRNGVLSSSVDLEAELRAAQLDDEQRNHLRAVLAGDTPSHPTSENSAPPPPERSRARSPLPAALEAGAAAARAMVEFEGWRLPPAVLADRLEQGWPLLPAELLGELERLGAELAGAGPGSNGAA